MIRAGGLIDGIEYIGDDEFVVTKERLQELMTNELFVEFYDQGYHYLWCERIPEDKLIDDNIKLYNIGIDCLSVDYNGYGQTVAIKTAQVLESITSTGSVITTEQHGAFLKIRSKCWVRTGIGESKAVLHGTDIVSILLSEGPYIATLISTSQL